MTSEFDKPQPTIADETSPLVDDRVVIQKTLPTAAPAAYDQRPGYLDKMVASTRSFVSANPARAAAMAAGGGALLAQLVLMSLRGRQH